MKLMLLALLLFPFSAFAGWNQQELPSNGKIYVCGAYTINEVNRDTGFLTDNPVQHGQITIKQWQTEYVMTPNVIFKDEESFKNPVGGTVTGLAVNANYLFIKRKNVNDEVYFLLYGFKTPNETEEFDRLIAIAQCKEQ